MIIHFYAHSFIAIDDLQINLLRYCKIIHWLADTVMSQLA